MRKIGSSLLRISSDGTEIPELPTAGYLEILAAKLRPAVSNLLLHHFSCDDFNLSKGMAHFLDHGQVLSPDPSSILNVSPFYVHSRSSSSLDTVEQAEIFTLQIMNKAKSLQREDAKDLMKNSIFIAKDYWQFKTQMKNVFLLWSLYTGKDSYLSQSLSNVNQYIDTNQPTYLDYINNQADFIVSFLHAIHFCMQSFFKSCVIAKEVDDIFDSFS